MHRALLVVLAVLLGLPAVGRAQDLTLQEMILRSKPAVVVVVAQVGGRVTLRCGGAEKTVSPAPYEETGSGFFLSPRGWVITNGHLVFVAHEPPRRGLASGERPDIEDGLVREAIAATPADRVTLEPAVQVVLQNRMRLAAKIAKYSAPSGGDAMSGRDLALLRVEATDMPTLPLGDSGALKIGDKLAVIGFPGVLRTHELLMASAQATVTHGAVSGFKQDRAN